MSGTNVVKIDMDKRFNTALFVLNDLIRAYNILRLRYNLPKILYWEVSPSENFKLHLVLILEREVGCWERYMIARLLGDDPMRSILNLKRCIDGEDADILFFAKREPKREGGTRV